MQRVAEDLGFTKMSLYRHVAGKAELLGVMIDTAVGELPDLSGVPGGWRPRLEEFVRQLTAIWQQHPWIPAVTVGSRVMGPREAGWIERGRGRWPVPDLTSDERLAAGSFCSGTSVTRSRWPPPEPSPVGGSELWRSGSAAMLSCSRSSATR